MACVRGHRVLLGKQAPGAGGQVRRRRPRVYKILMECYPLRQSSVFNDYNIVFLPYCTGDLFVGNKYTRGLQPAVPEPRHVYEQMQQRDGNMEVGIRELLDPEQIVKAGRSDVVCIHMGGGGQDDQVLGAGGQLRAEYKTQRVV
ncbi:hypothetical protein V7S43_014258 [Phytophthora oleae]|uniref:Uncharacterized protein n=1 Tax=Phytophthora oleae TaxID=2107226 RepID=A0ABD3F377_9STRA